MYKIFLRNWHFIGLNSMYYILSEREIGRVTREFLRQLSLKNGYILNLKNVSASILLDASIKSIVDTSDLENCLLKCLTN